MVTPVEPSKPSGGGGGHYYPASSMEIDMPEYSHEGVMFEVTSEQKNVKSIEWVITEGDEEADTKERVIGKLEKLGGDISINEAGIYTITAKVKNYGNRSYIFAEEIEIYEDYDIEVLTPKMVHTDTVLKVETTLSDNVTQQLN